MLRLTKTPLDAELWQQCSAGRASLQDWHQVLKGTINSFSPSQYVSLFCANMQHSRCLELMVPSVRPAGPLCAAVVAHTAAVSTHAVQDYEALPVEEFGKALLRGLGLVRWPGRGQEEAAGGAKADRAQARQAGVGCPILQLRHLTSGHARWVSCQGHFEML